MNRLFKVLQQFDISREFSRRLSPPTHTQTRWIFYGMACSLAVLGVITYTANPSWYTGLHVNNLLVKSDGTISDTYQMLAFWCDVYAYVALTFWVAAYVAAQAAHSTPLRVPALQILWALCISQLLICMYMILTGIWSLLQVSYFLYTSYWLLLAFMLRWIQRQHMPNERTELYAQYEPTRPIHGIITLIMYGAAFLFGSWGIVHIVGARYVALIGGRFIPNTSIYSVLPIGVPCDMSVTSANLTFCYCDVSPVYGVMLFMFAYLAYKTTRQTLHLPFFYDVVMIYTIGYTVFAAYASLQGNWNRWSTFIFVYYALFAFAMTWARPNPR